MIKIQNHFKNEAEAQLFVDDCERAFLSRLDAIASLLLDEQTLRILTLAGPTCSGKTTASHVIAQTLSQHDKMLFCVSIDDFYRERKENNSNQVSFESIDAIDYPYLKQCIETVLAQGAVKIPKFDFSAGIRAGYTPFSARGGDVLLLEGIQALYPEITMLLPQAQSRSLFICPANGVEADGVPFTPEELRFMRRLVRDKRERNATPQRTYKIWKSVRENEEKNIFPYASGASVTIDSTLVYEPFVIAPFVLRVLEDMPCDTVYEEKRKILTEKCRSIHPLSEKLVPQDSFFREFIGGGSI